MKTKTPFLVPLSGLRSAPVRDLAPRPALGRRVRSFVLHTLPLRSQRVAMPHAKPVD